MVKASRQAALLVAAGGHGCSGDCSGRSTGIDPFANNGLRDPAFVHPGDGLAWIVGGVPWMASNQSAGREGVACS